MSGNIDVTVENQLVRFVAPEPIDGDAVVQHLQGQRVGKMVIKALRRPRATLVIDPEGRITVHGTHRIEAARDAAKELLLRLGKDDTGAQDRVRANHCLVLLQHTNQSSIHYRGTRSRRRSLR